MNTRLETFTTRSLGPAPGPGGIALTDASVMCRGDCGDITVLHFEDLRAIHTSGAQLLSTLAEPSDKHAGTISILIYIVKGFLFKGGRGVSKDIAQNEICAEVVIPLYRIYDANLLSDD